MTLIRIVKNCLAIYVKIERALFLSVAGDRAHIGTYVGVMPSPASSENNLKTLSLMVTKFFLDIFLLTKLFNT